MNVETCRLNQQFEAGQFDIVVAGEILEHLSNPGRFLEDVRLLLTPTTELLITTPSAYCAYRFLYTLLSGKEGVNTDHVAYYSPSTCRVLLQRHGYSVHTFCYYAGDEYEEILNHGRGRLLWWTDRIAARFFPMLNDGLIFVCRIE